ncbi:Uncharacterized protein APZ42_028928 [Daphnia magna]|uniref:MULE transposase domain-containing protein n=1 Tax=Daphnia magna TaxID=35525 RepID=A0A164Q367_9CRUS|nr:Uncharacterized protein APZ42_028928 [Daphnia magna]
MITICNLSIYAFPVAFVLMTRKTHDLYTSVLRLIIRIYEDRFPEKPIAIYDMVTDFKLALMGAVSDVMDVESRGCWFHYGKAIIRKSGMLNLNRNYRRGGGVAVAHIIQELIGLALLPAERIYEGFENDLAAMEKKIGQIISLNELKEDEESKSRDFLTAENGDPIGRGSTPAQRKRKIARNSSLLEDGYLTIREFLEWTRKTFNVPLPADDEAAEDELNEEEAPEDIQGDVSNEDIPDIPYGHRRQRFRAGVRLTARQRRAIERRDRAAARHNRREILENLPARNETPPPGSPTPGSPLARPVTPPTRPDTPLFPPRPVTPLVSPFRPEALEIPPPVTPEIPPIRPLTPETHFRSMASPSGLMFADTSPRQKILEQRLLALRANRVGQHDESRRLLREEIAGHQRRAVARNLSPPKIKYFKKYTVNVLPQTASIRHSVQYFSILSVVGMAQLGNHRWLFQGIPGRSRASHELDHAYGIIYDYWSTWFLSFRKALKP